MHDKTAGDQHAAGGAAGAPEAPRARYIRFSGFDGCVELTNATTRVVLEPNIGGRVISYSLEGEEVLRQNPAQDGMAWDGEHPIEHPAAGRFDIGPEYGGLARQPAWFGRWQAAITGPGAARMTSQVLPDSGVQLSREFSLAETGSRLRCTQFIHNRGARPVRTFHWGRTFLRAGGIVFAPLPEAGRFPRGYSLGGPAGIIDFLPEPEPNIRIRDGVLEIVGAPLKAKFNFDVDPGWLAYLDPKGLLFVKTFAVYPDRPYGELAANNASVWYSSDDNAPTWRGRQHVVEVEPIGPLECIAPGDTCSFTENWSLERCAFPDDRTVDLGQVRRAVARAG